MESALLYFFSVYIFGFTASPATQIYRKYFGQEQKEEIQQAQELNLDETEKKYELYAAAFREKIHAVNWELFVKFFSCSVDSTNFSNSEIAMHPL